MAPPSVFLPHLFITIPVVVTLSEAKDLGMGEPVSRPRLDPRAHLCNKWLVLDSRVVDVPMASHPTFVTLFSWKAFFFKDLKSA